MTDTTPTSSLQLALDTARAARDRSQSQARQYIPELTRRLAITFGGLLGVALLITTVGAGLLALIIPNSTATLLSLAVSMWVLVNGWRWLEQRMKATSLFIVYTRFSRDRRDLEKLIQQAEDGKQVAAQLEQQREQVQQALDQFVAAMREAGAQPYQA